MHIQRTQRSRLLYVLLLLVLTNSPLSAAATGLNEIAAKADSSYLYTIRPGDTLWRIATAHAITVERLLALNSNLGDPKLLRPGQTIRVPGSPDQAAAPYAPVSATYTVRPDDTLWDIATNYGLSVDDLLAANSGVDPRRLMIGQQLLIPGIMQAALDAAPTADPAQQPTAPDSAQTTTPEGGLASALEQAASQAPEISPLALDLLNRINEKRLAGGRAALTWNNELAAAAQAHADDCARRNRGSHVGSDGARLDARLQRVGYAATWAGENWANAQSAERAMAIWWNEPPGADPHVQNIMANRATEIGIGVARGAWGIYFIADFGNR